MSALHVVCFFKFVIALFRLHQGVFVPNESLINRPTEMYNLEPHWKGYKALTITKVLHTNTVCLVDPLTWSTQIHFFKRFKDIYASRYINSQHAANVCNKPFCQHFLLFMAVGGQDRSASTVHHAAQRNQRNDAFAPYNYWKTRPCPLTISLYLLSSHIAGQLFTQQTNRPVRVEKCLNSACHRHGHDYCIMSISRCDRFSPVTQWQIDCSLIENKDTGNRFSPSIGAANILTWSYLEHDAGLVLDGPPLCMLNCICLCVVGVCLKREWMVGFDVRTANVCLIIMSPFHSSHPRWVLYWGPIWPSVTWTTYRMTPPSSDSTSGWATPSMRVKPWTNHSPTTASFLHCQYYIVKEGSIKKKAQNTQISVPSKWTLINSQ